MIGATAANHTLPICDSDLPVVDSFRAPALSSGCEGPTGSSIKKLRNEATTTSSQQTKAKRNSNAECQCSLADILVILTGQTPCSRLRYFCPYERGYISRLR